MAELADAPDLGSGSERIRGSSPLARTKFPLILLGESITHVSQTHVPDELYAEVKRHFEDKELVELTIIGMINLWNRMSVPFRSEPKARQ